MVLLSFSYSLKPVCAGRQLSAAAGRKPPGGKPAAGLPYRTNNTQPLEAFAAQYGQGLSNMLEANPGVDVFLPKSGTTLVIPQQLILPDTVREGIVVNVAEMRLYYYPPEGQHR